MCFVYGIAFNDYPNLGNFQIGLKIYHHKFSSTVFETKLSIYRTIDQSICSHFLVQLIKRCINLLKSKMVDGTASLIEIDVYKVNFLQHLKSMYVLVTDFFSIARQKILIEGCLVFVVCRQQPKAPLVVKRRLLSCG